MSTTVAKIRAVIEAETSGFERGTRKASSDLDRLGNDANRTGAQFDKLRKRMSEAFTGALNNAKQLGQMLAVGVTLPLVALAKGAVDAAVKMDSLKRGLTAVMGSSEAARRELVKLREVAKLPGLGFEEAIQGSIRLQAAGMAASEARRSLLEFGNALATVGKGKAELDGVTLALTQMISKGKIQAEEINQIAERVPQIRKIMKEVFGTADTEVLQKAKIQVEDFIRLILDRMGQIPRVTGGAANAFENFQDTVKDALREIGSAILPDVMRVISSLEPKIKEFVKWWKDLPQPVRETYIRMAAFIALIGPATVALGALAGGVSNLIGLLGSLRIAFVALGGPISGVVAVATAGVAALGKVFRDMNYAIEKGRADMYKAHDDRKAADPRAYWKNEINSARLRMQGAEHYSGGKEIIENNKRMIRRAYDELKKLDAEASKAKVKTDQTANKTDETLQKIRDRIAKIGQGKPKKDTAGARAAKMMARETDDARERIKQLTLNEYDFERYMAKKQYDADIAAKVNSQVAEQAYQLKLQDIIRREGEARAKLIEEQETRIAEIRSRRLEVGLGDYQRQMMQFQQEFNENMRRALTDTERGEAGLLYAARVKNLQKETNEAAARSVGQAIDQMSKGWAEFNKLRQRYAEKTAEELARVQEKEARERERAEEKARQIAERERERVEQTTQRLREHILDAQIQIGELTNTLSDAQRIYHEVGVEAMTLTEEQKKMMEQIINLRLEVEKLEKSKAFITEIARDLSGVIMDTLDQMYENGFKGFFESIYQGFRRLLWKMAMEWISSQLLRLLQNALGGLVGGLIGGGARTGGGGGGLLPSGVSSGGAAFGNAGFAPNIPRFAKGGYAFAGQPILVGDGGGPELFVPQSAGRVYSRDETNEMLGGNQTIVINNHFHFPPGTDVGGFMRSKQAVAMEVRGSMDRAIRRGG